MTSSIGIFDSGFGGLSVLKEVVKVLPQYDYVYLGDTARAPYGNRTQDEIYTFTKEGILFLFEKGCELVILACNSASAEALHILQIELIKGENKNKRILGVIIPASEEAVEKTISKKVGVLGTEATISSRAFEREIKKINPSIEVFGVPAPLLVPLVESGKTSESEGVDVVVAEYTKYINKHAVDTVILGCTHYEFLKECIQKNLPSVSLITEGSLVASKLSSYLLRHRDIEERLSRCGKRSFFTTGETVLFDDLGSGFFGDKITSFKVSL